MTEEKVKPTVVFDVDGVLLDLVSSSIIPALHELYPENSFSLDDFTCQNLAETLGLSKRSEERLFDLVWDIPAAPYPYVSSLLRMFKHNGRWNVVVCSKRKGKAEEALKRDLSPFLYMVDEVVTLPLSGNKGDALAHLPRLDVQLEDTLEYAMEVCERFPNVKSYLISRPWNCHSAILDADVTTVYNDNHLLEEMRWIIKLFQRN